MKKFKWFDDIREINPSKENQVIIKSLDTVIKRIVSIHNFKSMFENLKYYDYYPDKIENESSLRYGDFKDFLETNFRSIIKSNIYSMFPPLFGWFINFGEISIKLDREEAECLLMSNIDLYKDKIRHYCNDIFELKTHIYYDLSKDEFTSYI